MKAQVTECIIAANHLKTSLQSAESIYFNLLIYLKCLSDNSRIPGEPDKCLLSVQRICLYMRQLFEVYAIENTIL